MNLPAPDSRLLVNRAAVADPEAAGFEDSDGDGRHIDDPVRMYLTQMGEISLLTREEEIRLAKKIETCRMIFRRKVLENDYCVAAAVEILEMVNEGDLPFDRTMKISTAEEDAKGTTMWDVYREAYTEMYYDAGPKFMKEHMKRLTANGIQTHFQVGCARDLDNRDQSDEPDRIGQGDPADDRQRKGLAAAEHRHHRQQHDFIDGKGRDECDGIDREPAEAGEVTECRRCDDGRSQGRGEAKPITHSPMPARPPRIRRMPRTMPGRTLSVSTGTMQPTRTRAWAMPSASRPPETPGRAAAPAPIGATARSISPACCQRRAGSRSSARSTTASMRASRSRSCDGASKRPSGRRPVSSS